MTRGPGRREDRRAPASTLLREHFGVEVDDGADGELDAAIGDYDGTADPLAPRKVTPEVLARATNLKAIGRAGVGVDNVDVPAATKRGIIVANAPESNVVTAAEHTMALLLALARNVPQAHGSLVDGRWDRSKYSRRRADGQDPGHPRLRPHRAAGGRARPRASACA